MKYKNIYLETNDYLVITMNSDKYGIKNCHIDKEDFEKVKNYNWFVQDGYVTTNIRKEDGTRGTMRLHRLILNYFGKKHIDHINHNTLDNRKTNLKIVENYENQQNAVRKSKHCGVYKQKNGKYTARIKVKGREIYLGIFETLEEAINERKNAELKYWDYKREVTNG